MANPINDGGPAFPVIPPQDEHGIGSAPGYPFPDTGMSLRDWLAGKALTGTISNVDAMNKIFAGLDDGEDLTMAVAKSSYEFADAMLKAREVKP